MVFDLTRSPEGIISLSNTEARREEVRVWCQAVLAAKEVSPAQLAVFASRVRWLDGHVHGRLGRVALKILLLKAVPSKDRRPQVLSAELAWAVTWILNHIPLAKPKLFGAPPANAWFLFTDGAVENGKAGIGAVLCDKGCRPVSCFGCQVPPTVLRAWQACGTEHPVFQAELLAVVAAIHVWPRELLQSLCTVFLDNEAVKSALIKGSAYPESNQALLENFLVQEASLDASFWFDRVPSACNPSDGPSRGVFPQYLKQANRVEVDVGLLDLLALCSLR